MNEESGEGAWQYLALGVLAVVALLAYVKKGFDVLFFYAVVAFVVVTIGAGFFFVLTEAIKHLVEVGYIVLGVTGVLLTLAAIGYIAESRDWSVKYEYEPERKY